MAAAAASAAAAAAAAAATAAAAAAATPTTSHAQHTRDEMRARRREGTHACNGSAVVLDIGSINAQGLRHAFVTYRAQIRF